MAEIVGRRREHALAIPLPAQGHLISLMRLCKTLASQGMAITFLNIDPIHHQIAQLHQQDDSDSGDEDQLDIRIAHLPVDGIDLSDGFNLSFENLFEAVQGLSDGLEQLIETLNCGDLPVTCLISDVFMTCPTQKVADKFNIPRVALFPCSQAMQLLIFYLVEKEISSNYVLDVVMKASGRLKVEAFPGGLVGFPMLHNEDLPHFRHVHDESKYFYRFMMRECKEANKRAHAIVVNSFDGLEDNVFEALKSRLDTPILQVGPFMEHDNRVSMWKEDMTCLEWLDKQPPCSVLYISFGSITLLSESQFEEIVAGLHSSQQRFLWVFRSNLIINSARIDFDSIMSDLLSKSNDKGCIVSWAPQPRVLSHPSLGGFLTHCGWNSTLESIGHGVPMLCWPYFADQFMNAKYIVEEWEVGLGFEPSGEDCLITRQEVERVIRALMEGEKGKKIINNAIKLKESSRRCLSPGGNSHNNIQALIESLKDPPQHMFQ